MPGLVSDFGLPMHHDFLVPVVGDSGGLLAPLPMDGGLSWGNVGLVSVDGLIGVVSVDWLISVSLVLITSDIDSRILIVVRIDVSVSSEGYGGRHQLNLNIYFIQIIPINKSGFGTGTASFSYFYSSHSKIIQLFFSLQFTYKLCDGSLFSINFMSEY